MRIDYISILIENVSPLLYIKSEAKTGFSRSSYKRRKARPIILFLIKKIEKIRRGRQRIAVLARKPR